MPWYPSTDLDYWNVFGNKVFYMDSAVDSSYKLLENSVVMDVLDENWIASHEELEAILNRKVSWLNYHKFESFFQNVQITLKRLSPNYYENDIFLWLNKKKGTSHIRQLLRYQLPDPQSFTSTKGWALDIGQHLPSTIMLKAFKLLSKIDVSPKVRSDLLKIRHRITGTNNLVSKWDPTVNDVCNFCQVGNADIASCFSGNLIGMLYECHIINNFWQQLTNCVGLSSVGLGRTKVDRLVYFESGGKNERFNNIIILLVIKFIRNCNFQHKIPTVKACLESLSKDIKSMVKNQKEFSPLDKLAELSLDIEIFLDEQSIPNP